MKNVFITGVSGCVGHYLIEELSKNPDYHFYLYVRDSKRLKFSLQDRKNITIIQDEIKNISHHGKILKEMDCLIHLSASWGSNEENYDHTLELFNSLDPNRCQKVIYFSTASILGTDNKPLPEAKTLGTHYIVSKYDFHKKLPELKIYPKVVTLFPTWILGGDKNHPYSHASAGLLGLKNWLWLIRFLTVDIGFHFIHARDIALITKQLLENEVREKEYVLGNAPITASEFIKQTCEFFGQKVFFQIPIPLTSIPYLAKLIGKELHSWDLFCFKKRHFIYKTVNAESFGLKSDLITVKQILAT